MSASRSLSTRAPLAAALLALVSLAGAAAGRPQEDAWVPVDPIAAATLARADGELERALAGGAGAELAWTRAFDAWGEALRESEPGVLVDLGPRDERGEPRPALDALLPDPDHGALRKQEAVEYAVLRRLEALPRPRAARRGAPGASRAQRGAAGRAEDARARAADLARREREYPASEAALRAAVERFELELEAGRPAQAASWLTRAERHARLVDPERFAAGLARRRAALDALEIAPAAPAPVWPDARELVPERLHPLVLPDLRKVPAMARIDPPAGLAFLADGRRAVQTSDRVWLLGAGVEDRSYQPWAPAREHGWPWPVTAERPGRDWPLLPATDGEDLYLVAGRADGTTSNLVQRARPPRELEIPELRWTLGGDGLYVGDARVADLEALLGPGLWEFQPGPLLVDDLVVVQARQWSQVEQDGLRQVNAPGEARGWVLALDADSGRPRWRRLVARGTDVVRDLGLRTGGGQLLRTPAAPPVRVGGYLFVGTHLGVGALLDLADGRPAWSFHVARRAPEEAAWADSTAPIVERRPDAAAAILWGPRDATRLYCLAGELDLAPGRGALLLHPPLEVPEAERLVGGDRDVALVQGRAGARRTLSAYELASGRRYDSIFLGREEVFLGRALVSERKVLCLTDRGLYRFDRARELYLEAVTPVLLDGAWEAGGLWARGAAVVALAGGELYEFRAR
ncbi:MAG: PQQ-binding-like beta-propeller repeat protein [Planctomycetes bacterium]|nr:PQQ-binding-like beta-propeller repeat protein [Planctomycetota bacterium]